MSNMCGTLDRISVASSPIVSFALFPPPANLYSIRCIHSDGGDIILMREQKRNKTKTKIAPGIHAVNKIARTKKVRRINTWSTLSLAGLSGEDGVEEDIGLVLVLGDVGVLVEAKDLRGRELRQAPHVRQIALIVPLHR